jgi:hypothetical protein
VYKIKLNYKTKTEIYLKTNKVIFIIQKMFNYLIYITFLSAILKFVLIYKYPIMIFILQRYVQLKSLIVNINKDMLYKDKFRYIKTTHLNHDDMCVVHYDGYIDDKHININVVSHIESDKSDISKVISNSIHDKLHLKSKIVNCSLMDEDDNEIYDVTSLFREFIFHFEGQDEKNKLKYFFKYLEVTLGISVNHLNFVVYINNDDFTEQKFAINSLSEQFFHEIIC